MSNTLYENEIYNEEIKREYLQQYKANTQKTVERIFKASSLSENDLNKDLYAFNREEIRLFLFTLRPKRFNASRQNGNLISNYINWAIEKGYRQGLNPLNTISKEWYEQFVDEDDQQLFTEDELKEIVEKCENAQDAVIVQLIMEGCLGEANEELLNLRGKDINYNNSTLRLYDNINKTERVLPVSENCIRLCRQALNETEYEKSNGEASPTTRAPLTNLVENEYVIKSSMTNTKNMGKAEKNIIHRRLDVLSRYFSKPNLTPTNIQYSGMLIMARELYLRDGELGKNQYVEILERFNPNYSKDDFDSAYHRLRSNFLNIETLKKMYQIES